MCIHTVNPAAWNTSAFSWSGFCFAAHLVSKTRTNTLARFLLCKAQSLRSWYTVYLPAVCQDDRSVLRVCLRVCILWSCRRMFIQAEKLQMMPSGCHSDGNVYRLTKRVVSMPSFSWLLWSNSESRFNYFKHLHTQSYLSLMDQSWSRGQLLYTFLNDYFIAPSWYLLPMTDSPQGLWCVTQVILKEIFKVKGFSVSVLLILCHQMQLKNCY